MMSTLPLYTFGASVVLATLFMFLHWLRLSLNVTSLGVADAHAKRIRIGLGAVMAVWFLGALLVASGPIFFAPGSPAVPPLAVLAASQLPVLGASVAIALLPGWRLLVGATPVAWLIAAHTLRAGFGFVILTAFGLGTLPTVFALEAGLGDVVIGLSAPLVAYLYVRGVPHARRVAFAWNVLGLLDLLNAFRLGGASLLQFGEANGTPVLIGMIPLLSAPLFVIGHLYLFRLLARDRRAGIPRENRATDALLSSAQGEGA